MQPKKTTPDNWKIRRPFLFFIVLSFHALCVNAQVAEFSIQQSSNCYPQTVTFEDLSQGNVTKWAWDFGNGSTPEYTTLPETIAAAYTLPGIYTVKLTVYPSGNSKTRELIVREKPEVSFSFEIPASTCAPATVNFLNASKDVVSENLTYTWIFGDGGSSKEKDPVYQYNLPGDYSVTLIVENEFGCETTLLKSNAINITGPAKNFTIETEGSLCTPPVEISFKAEEEQASTYNWDFGDGQSGSGKTTTHVYQAAGKYVARLSLTDANNCNAIFEREILVGQEGGIELLVSSEKICQKQPVSFSQQVSGIIQTISWDFGDGSSSSEIDPVKTYSTPGKYKVILDVQIAGKECASTVEKEIEVLATPSPAFTFKSDCDAGGTFTNTSLNSSSWVWDFGDGTPTSTQQSPKHVYSQRGSFTVSLTALNSLGCDSTIQKIVTIDPLPNASFSPSTEQDCNLPSLSGCAPFTLELENQSTGVRPISKVNWTFGDGSTSDSKEVSINHTYENAGSFTLKLVVTDDAGCIGQYSANVNVADVSPIANFTLEDTVVCPGQDVRFTNLSTNADFYCWNMGDSTRENTQDVVHQYHKPGYYDVKLTVKNAGCQDEIKVTRAVRVQSPLIQFGLNKTCSQPYDVSVQNLGADYDSFVWDFGDGTRDSTNLALNHHYNETGFYDITLTGINSTTGCGLTVKTTVAIQDLEANFTIDKVDVCLGDSVHVENKSSFDAAHSWNFNNGKPEVNTDKAGAAFDTPGDYDIVLIVQDSDGCIEVKSVNINVLDIRGDFSTSLFSYCDSLRVSFTDLSQGTPPIEQWQWNFGDGKKADVQNPEHMFYVKGDYTIQLKLTNADGNFCELIRQNAIKFTAPNPDFIVNEPGYCLEENIQFINTTKYNYDFEWIFGNGKTSTERNPITNYNELGTHSVTLVAKDELGCIDEITKQNIISITKPVAEFTTEDTFKECPPLSATFINESENALSWRWDLGDGKISQVENPLHTYARPGSFDIQLIATDQNGCNDTISYEEIIVVGGPSGTISVSPLTICQNDTAYYRAEATNALVYKWDFGDGNIVDLPFSETFHHYRNIGNANVSAIFIDANGCEVAAIDTFSVQIVSIPTAAFSYNIQYPFQDEEVRLKAETEANNFEWFLENEAIGTGESHSIIFGDPGTRNVTLRTTNENLCTRDTTMQIPVQARIPFVPNVFTPNSDSSNPTFDIPFIREGFWNLRVFNRWGEMVYSNDEYKGNWNSEGISTGVYFYLLENNYRPVSFKGIVHVLR